MNKKYFSLALITFVLFCSAMESQSSTKESTKSQQAEKKVKKPKRFPLGCSNVGFYFKTPNVLLKPILTEQQQTIYFIHNISPHRIHFESIKPPEDLYALTYQTDIDPQRWAAFAFDFPQILFTCSTIQRQGQTTPADCSTLLDICEYPCVKFPDHGAGNYWASENSSMVETIYNANRGMGILLRSCARGGDVDEDSEQ